MVDRVKMSRAERAKQFAPFDALKGLQEAIKLKEFEHEMISKNELSADEIIIISNTLQNVNKNDLVKIEFFRDGHIIKLKAEATVDAINQIIKVGAFVIDFEDIKKLEIVKQKDKNQWDILVFLFSWNIQWVLQPLIRLLAQLLQGQTLKELLVNLS